MSNNEKKKPELLVDSHHGVYIPQVFCQSYQQYITNFDEIKEDFNICLLSPESEHYFDAWDNLINRVKLTNDKGEKFTIGYLYDESDLWAIPEGYDFSEDE